MDTIINLFLLGIKQCFNRAIAFQRWILGTNPQILYGYNSFNRAIAFQRWIHNRAKACTYKIWYASIEPSLFSDGYAGNKFRGKRLDNASIEPSLFSDGYVHVSRKLWNSFSQVSIEPSLFSDGYTVGHGWEIYGLSCFNRAIAFQRWIL